jgi:uncharacterized membrane protein YecN with MAPEG domain
MIDMQIINASTTLTLTIVAVNDKHPYALWHVAAGQNKLIAKAKTFHDNPSGSVPPMIAN